ncbi:DUF3261 domain-containing protein [Stenotrophomonas koreensis]|nr:DUF3261 domain-containing protein [Stenotrophomonas koreensis]
MRLFLALALCLLLLAAGGCAGNGPRPGAAVALPPLRLAPSSLPAPLALQQALQFRLGSHQREMTALLESDADAVRLAVQAMGQTGVRLSWDGRQLQQQRAPWLPSQVRGERVLDDLQFAYWPEDAIAAALPAGWQLQVSADGRQLRHAGKTWLETRRQADGVLLLHNHVEGYQLLIQSQALGTGELP